MFGRRDLIFSFLTVIAISLILVNSQVFSEEPQKDKTVTEAGATATTTVDMSGTWKGTMYISKIDVYDEMILVLKKEGTSYKGTVTDSLGTVYETPIQNVKLQAEELHFDFTLFFSGFHTIQNVAKGGGQKLVIKWRIEEQQLGGAIDFRRVTNGH